jgi:hypothetical protein
MFVGRYSVKLVVTNTTTSIGLHTNRWLKHLRNDCLGQSLGRNAFILWTRNRKNITLDDNLITEGGSNGTKVLMRCGWDVALAVNVFFWWLSVRFTGVQRLQCWGPSEPLHRWRHLD